jgi:hypothetical protein
MSSGRGVGRGVNTGWDRVGREVGQSGTAVRERRYRPLMLLVSAVIPLARICGRTGSAAALALANRN